MYYFYLQKTKCRVPLTEEVCQLELDEKRTLIINRTLERIWIYWLYGGVDNLGVTYIRAFLKEYRSHMTDLRINRAIELFIEQHKPEHVLNFEPNLEHFEWAKMPDAFEKNLGTMFYETKKYVPMMDERVSDFQNIALHSTDKYERLLEWFERNKTTRKTVQNNERVVAWATMVAMQYGIPMNGYHFTDYVVEKYGTTTFGITTAIPVVDNRRSEMSEESINNRSFILLQSCNSKVFLLSDKEGEKPYVIKFGQNKIKIDYFMESWLVMEAYRYGRVGEWLRSIDENVGPDVIDEFIEQFKKDHPLHLMEYNYSYDMVPLIATEREYCKMNLNEFKHTIKITHQQELELINIIKSNRDNKKAGLKAWFSQYRSKYGINCRLKRDIQSQDEILSEAFCQIHGIVYEWIDIPTTEERKKKNEQENVKIVRKIFTLILGVSLGIWLMDSCSFDINDSGAEFFIGMLIIFITLIITFWDFNSRK